MLEVVKQLIEYRNEKKDTVLVGIVESSGSLPRKRGAYMLVGAKGRVAGTVGGGNLEFQAISYGQQMFEEGNTDKLRENIGYHILTLELNLEESANLGMVCGGRAKLLFYPILWREARLENWISDWKNALDNGEDYELTFYDIYGGSQSNQKVILEKYPVICRENIAGDGIVYIIGAGHLAKEVVPLLVHLNFRCIVLDDRKEFADPHLFPNAKEVKLVDFEKLDESINPQKEDYIVIMTRGHQWDFCAECFALKTKAHYIGVVGSRKKTAFVNEKLIEAGFTRENISRIITPIGLDIGSETPAEIAISIVAQLIQVKSQRESLKTAKTKSEN